MTDEKDEGEKGGDTENFGPLTILGLDLSLLTNLNENLNNFNEMLQAIAQSYNLDTKNQQEAIKEVNKRLELVAKNRAKIEHSLGASRK